MKWIEEHRFTSVIIIMLIIWFSLLTFFFIKADEITKDPCSICAASKGDKVFCRIGDVVVVERIYNPNGSIEEITPEIKDNYEEPTFDFGLN
ncbi:MAG: hypothetical protein WD512_00010 [Candidatus Paceibacterota bacterium]